MHPSIALRHSLMRINPRSWAAASSVFLLSGGVAVAVAEAFSMSSTMKATDVGGAQMIPVDVTVGVMEGVATTGKDMIASNSKEFGSLAFVVRRPG